MAIENYQYVTDYGKDKVIWESLNVLTQEVFNFRFQEVVGEQYIPHSLLDGDQMVANVSVNIMNFKMDGIHKNYLQLGTVMTKKEYRGQGLSRYLIQKILEAYQDQVDGIYLFANNSVLDFYPKFGFDQTKEFQYSKMINSEKLSDTIEKMDLSDTKNQKQLFATHANQVANERLAMDYLGLLKFWLLGPMSDQVYYVKNQDAYVIAECEGDVLHIHQVIASHQVDLEKIIYSFWKGIKKVKLGFTPYNSEGYTIEAYHKDDCTLFYIGEDLKLMEVNQLIFPTLSHA